MIYIEPTIQKPYFTGKGEDSVLGNYLKELKEAKKEIEKAGWTFEKLGLCNIELKKRILEEIRDLIKLCEHYFKTKKRKDLFKWIFQEKYKSNNWDSERDIWSYSNGKVKGVIEIFKNLLSTKITYSIKSDCDLYLYFRNLETSKNLRSEESIKSYIEEIKIYLESELKKVKYGNKKEREFYEFVLNEGGSENEIH
jgi:hypothetical protein